MSDLNDAVEGLLKVTGDPTMAQAYREALLSVGIDPGKPIEAPDPGEVIEPEGLELYVDHKSEREGVRKESLPMRLLRKPRIQDGGNRFPGYKSFMLIDVWHPTVGRKLLTHSYEKTEGGFTPLGEWLFEIKPGDVFQVGEIPTGKGFKVYRPISVR